MAPFRSKTVNYTGHKQSPRDQIYQNLKQEIDNVIEKCRFFIEKKFIDFEQPYEITQFLRGELYIILDFCLSKTQQSAEANAIKTFIEFFLEFTMIYLDHFLLNLKEVFFFFEIVKKFELGTRNESE